MGRCPATAALLALLLAGCRGPGEASEASDGHPPIRPAERALARAAWQLGVEHRPPTGDCPLGDTGLDWAPLLQAVGEHAAHHQLVTGNPPERVVALLSTLVRARRVATLGALLDHPAAAVRQAALQALRGLRDRRSVAALLAAAKHNAFATAADDCGSMQRAYRQQLAAALTDITRVTALPGSDGNTTFDFGRLDQWVEQQVLRAERW